jgi:hypothetical protein
MATQTRRTTQQSGKFHRATLKASIVTACCGLVLWSAVAAHAAASWNGIDLNGMPFQGLILNGTPRNGVPLNGVIFNGMPINGVDGNGMPFQGMPRNGLPMNGTPLHGHPANEGSVPPVQSESLPWSTLSQRPLGTSMP